MAAKKHSRQRRLLPQGSQYASTNAKHKRKQYGWPRRERWTHQIGCPAMSCLAKTWKKAVQELGSSSSCHPKWKQNQRKHKQKQNLSNILYNWDALSKSTSVDEHFLSHLNHFYTDMQLIPLKHINYRGPSGSGHKMQTVSVVFSALHC